MTTPEPTTGDGTATCENPECPELGIPKTCPAGTAPPVYCGGFGPGFYCGAELEIQPNVAAPR